MSAWERLLSYERSWAGGPDDPPMGGVKARAVSFVLALGFIAIDAYLTAVDAVVSHVIGGPALSPDAESMFTNLDRGDQAMADLDAIDAALQLSGGAGEAATIAVGVFFDAADEYSGGL